MAGNFLSPEGDLEKIFVTDYEMIDQFAATGSLWSWGTGNYGALGDDTIAAKSSPVQTIAGGTNWKQVACGSQHTAAIKSDGTLWIWGRNASGQLGDNTIVNKSSPIQTIAGGTNWKQVACGPAFTAAINTTGQLWMWGVNTYYQLGNANQVSSPVQTIAGGTDWKQVSCGYAHTAAIKTDGTLWSWGISSSGELGNEDPFTLKSSAVQTVAGGTDWKQVSCGYNWSGAIKTDGTLWLWGNNAYGQLGDNTTVSKSSPIQTVAGGTNWKQLSCGDNHTAAIKTDGTLWLWGNNATYGTLGDSTTVSKSSPIQTVAGGTNWKQVSAGARVTMAIKTDGSLWTWGYNSFGQLGDNTQIAKSSPVQTIASGTNWKQVSSGIGSTTTNTSSAIYFYDAGNLYPNS